MTIIKDIPVTRFYLDFFTLSIEEKKTRIYMTMSVNPRLVTTKYIPCVRKTLEQKIPGIFSTKCFNYKKQPFFKEVVNTELGHLLEHIILEKFCELKSRLGYQNFTIRGNTEWDWFQNPRGMFLITINAQRRDRVIFYKALRESIFIYNALMHTCINDQHVPSAELLTGQKEINRHPLTQIQIQKPLNPPQE